MTDSGKTVLIVEDEFLIAMYFSSLVQDMGAHVCAVADTADAAVTAAQEHRPQVVLMDVRLNGAKDGVDAALQIHELVGSKVIFVTGSREQSTLDRINSDHPYAILFKPVADRALTDTIRRAFEGANAGASPL